MKFILYFGIFRIKLKLNTFDQYTNIIIAKMNIKIKNKIKQEYKYKITSLRVVLILVPSGRVCNKDKGNIEKIK